MTIPSLSKVFLILVFTFTSLGVIGLERHPLGIDAVLTTAWAEDEEFDEEDEIDAEEDDQISDEIDDEDFEEAEEEIIDDAMDDILEEMDDEDEDMDDEDEPVDQEDIDAAQAVGGQTGEDLEVDSALGN